MAAGHPTVVMDRVVLHVELEQNIELVHVHRLHHYMEVRIVLEAPHNQPAVILGHVVRNIKSWRAKLRILGTSKVVP